MKKLLSLSVVLVLLLGILAACNPTAVEEHEHLWIKGKCFICGIECEHDFSEKTGFCSICGIACTHEGGHDADAVCYTCGQFTYHDYVDGVCTTCGATTNTAYDVPEAYKEECDEQGTVIEGFVYHTQNYSYVELFETELVGVTKKCNIYLPYGYNEETQYNFIYLLHGQGEDEGYWFVWEDLYGYANYTTNVFDWMIKNGDVEPFIAVACNIHTDLENYDDPSLVDPDNVLAERNADDDFIQGNANGFKFYEMVYYNEIRDLAKQLEAVYATYADANGDGEISDEELTDSKNHRAMAGFSVGANISTCSALQAYDFIGFFGAFSGGFSAKYTDVLLEFAETMEAEGNSVYLFVSAEEKTEGIEESRELYEVLTEKGTFWVKEETLKFLDIKGGKHTYPWFMSGLYNALHFFFLEDPSTGNVNG